MRLKGGAVSCSLDLRTEQQGVASTGGTIPVRPSDIHNIGQKNSSKCSFEAT